MADNCLPTNNLFPAGWLAAVALRRAKRAGEEFGYSLVNTSISFENQRETTLRRAKRAGKEMGGGTKTGRNQLPGGWADGLEGQTISFKSRGS